VGGDEYPSDIGVHKLMSLQCSCYDMTRRQGTLLIIIFIYALYFAKIKMVANTFYVYFTRIK
jgi:hypothetical protein